MIQRETGKLSDIPAVFWIFAFSHFQRHCLNELLLPTKNSDSNSISTRIKKAYLSVYSILPHYMALLKRISLASTFLPSTVFLWRLRFQVFLSLLSLYGKSTCYANVDVSIVILGVLGSKVQNCFFFNFCHASKIHHTDPSPKGPKNTRKREKNMTKKERKKKQTKLFLP